MRDLASLMFTVHKEQTSLGKVMLVLLYHNSLFRPPVVFIENSSERTLTIIKTVQ